ncbi:transposase domain-containing protein [Lysinibacillus xylanilyticus]|uniref:transposase domain-containing protein n=1 Tax=Lysinibacillus xylanilyticus TaxID=582475 RepID=UPI002B24C36F|nr:transposase domain-containing protein [Lysinibacillus xylanilyticus]
MIGRKSWLFSVSEAGAKANAICLSLAETAKANGIDFYQYLVTLMTKIAKFTDSPAARDFK